MVQCQANLPDPSPELSVFSIGPRPLSLLLKNWTESKNWAHLYRNTKKHLSQPRLLIHLNWYCLTNVTPQVLKKRKVFPDICAWRCFQLEKLAIKPGNVSMLNACTIEQTSWLCFWGKKFLPRAKGWLASIPPSLKKIKDEMAQIPLLTKCLYSVCHFCSKSDAFLILWKEELLPSLLYPVGIHHSHLSNVFV